MCSDSCVYPISAELASLKVLQCATSNPQSHLQPLHQALTVTDHQPPLLRVLCRVSSHPADCNQLLMPALWGGVDGANLTRDLLSAGFGSAMLLISAYSNPVYTLQYARDQGYVVVDFLVQPLPFGTYTSQDIVVQHLHKMKARGEAFYRDTGAGRKPYYFLAGVLFQKPSQGQEIVDLSEELLSVMCAL
jgi:hypothetical protein